MSGVPLSDADRALRAAITDWEVPAVNSDAGFDHSWRHAFVSLRIADVLAQLAIGDHLHTLPVADRAWLRGQADALVQDVLDRYEGWTS